MRKRHVITRITVRYSELHVPVSLGIVYGHGSGELYYFKPEGIKYDDLYKSIMRYISMYICHYVVSDISKRHIVYEHRDAEAALGLS